MRKLLADKGFRNLSMVTNIIYTLILTSQRGNIYKQLISTFISKLIIISGNMNVHCHLYSTPLQYENEHSRVRERIGIKMDSPVTTSRMKVKLWQRIPPYGRRHSCSGSTYQYTGTKSDAFAVSKNSNTLYKPPQPLENKTLSSFPSTSVIVDVSKDQKGECSNLLKFLFDSQKQHKDITVDREKMRNDITVESTVCDTSSDSRSSLSMMNFPHNTNRINGCVPRRSSMPFRTNEKIGNFDDKKDSHHLVMKADKTMEYFSSSFNVSNQFIDSVTSLASNVPANAIPKVRNEMKSKLSPFFGRNKCDYGKVSKGQLLYPALEKPSVKDLEVSKSDNFNLSRKKWKQIESSSLVETSLASKKTDLTADRQNYKGNEEAKQSTDSRNDVDHVSLLRELVRNHLSKQVNELEEDSKKDNLISQDDSLGFIQLDKKSFGDISDDENTTTKSDENAEPFLSDGKEEVKIYPSIVRRSGIKPIVSSKEKSILSRTLHEKKEIKFEQCELSRWGHIETVSSPPQSMVRSGQYATGIHGKCDKKIKPYILASPTIRKTKPKQSLDRYDLRQRVLCPYQDIDLDADDDFFPSYFRRRTKKKKRRDSGTNKPQQILNVSGNIQNGSCDFMRLIRRNLYSISENCFQTSISDIVEQEFDVVAMKIGMIRRRRKKRCRNRQQISYAYAKSYHSNSGYVEAKRLIHSIQTIKSLFRVGKMYEENKDYHCSYFQYVDSLQLCHKQGTNLLALDLNQ